MATKPTSAEIEALSDPMRKYVEQLEDKVSSYDFEISELQGEIQDLEGNQGTDLDKAWRALHMLHEQAHGGTPWRVCTEEPCRDLQHLTSRDRTAGPAQLSMAGAA